MGTSRTKLVKSNSTLVGFDGKETGLIESIKILVMMDGVT